ncbi:PREDICTED: EKC/KEOPS complex subunit TPRKB-like [Dinoponera quadriceps]|uniref:EKC/KEOPS complex subunit TPRKB-like n=1 Tax=Dinoponera quadriceps TaxID=609295 RepID=A0A6P3XCN5_DINQU|nr:PREDICTED: EKC/KEOPS complex subunit TPRKB-like [Dinoponera quadriceps]
MENYSVKLDPETQLCCTLYMFTDVTNIAEIREKVVSRSLRCCAAKASLMVDALQAVVAANKATLNAERNCLTTKDVYTEILFCLSMSKNISRSLQEFGVSDSDKNIVVIIVHKLGEEQTVSADVLKNVKGERVIVSRMREFADVNLVKRIYKVDEDELCVSDLTDAVVSRIACKDFMLVK